MTPTPPTKPRPRRVFGRVAATIDGQRYRIEMTRQGIAVRKWHGRHLVYVHWPELIALATQTRPTPPPEPHPELFVTEVYTPTS